MKHETEGLHEQKGRTEQVSQFQRACSQICTCCQLPSSGHFTVGKIYAVNILMYKYTSFLFQRQLPFYLTGLMPAPQALIILFGPSRPYRL